MHVWRRALLVSLALLALSQLTAGATSYFNSKVPGLACANTCEPTECLIGAPCRPPDGPVAPTTTYDIAIFEGVYSLNNPLTIDFSLAPPSDSPIRVFLASDGSSGMNPGLNAISGLSVVLTLAHSVHISGFGNASSPSTQALNCAFSLDFAGRGGRLLEIDTVDFTNPQNANTFTIYTEGSIQDAVVVRNSSFSATVANYGAVLPPAFLFYRRGFNSLSYIPRITVSGSTFSNRTGFGTNFEGFHYTAGVSITDCTFDSPAIDFSDHNSSSNTPAAPVNISITRSSFTHPYDFLRAVLTFPPPQTALSLVITSSDFFLDRGSLFSESHNDSRIDIIDSTLNAAGFNGGNALTFAANSHFVNGSELSAFDFLLLDGCVVSDAKGLGSFSLVLKNTSVQRSTLLTGALSLTGSNISDSHQMVSVSGDPYQFNMLDSYMSNTGLSINTPFSIVNSTIDMSGASPTQEFALGSARGSVVLGFAYNFTVVSPTLGSFTIGNVTFTRGSSLTIDNLQLTSRSVSFGSLEVTSQIVGNVNGTNMIVTPNTTSSQQGSSSELAIWTFRSIQLANVSVNTNGLTSFDYIHSASSGITTTSLSPSLTLNPSLPINIAWDLGTSAPENGNIYNLFNHSLTSTASTAQWTPLVVRGIDNPYLFSATASSARGIHFQTGIALPPNRGVVTIPGNVTTSTPIVYTGAGTTLIIDGCLINITAGLLFEFDGKFPSGTLLALVQNADCPESLENIPLNFSAPNARPCENNKVLRGSQTSKTQLYVLFLFDDSKCKGGKSWPIIVGSVLGAIVVIGVVVTIIAVQIWKSKHNSKTELAKLKS